MESTVLLGALGTALGAFVASLLFYPALRLRPSARTLAFVCIAGLLATVPWILPAEARIPRFLVALYAGVLALKVWDLHVGAAQSVRPGWAEFVAFMANVWSLVHRRTGFQRRPPARHDTATLARSLVVGSLGLAAVFFLLRLSWASAPFLVEHLAKGTAFFVGASALFSAAAAGARLLGVYAPEPMQRPLAARSPADFWRRYNRWIGEGLSEDVFSLLGGRRHPVGGAEMRTVMILAWALLASASEVAAQRPSGLEIGQRVRVLSVSGEERVRLVRELTADAVVVRSSESIRA